MLAADPFLFGQRQASFQSIGELVMTNRVLRRTEVEKKTGLPRSSIYAQMAQNKFPKPTHRLSARTVGWDEEIIDNFLKSREVKQ